MFTEIIAIFSLLIIVIGWFINNHLNRKNDIAKIRFEYRINALHKFFDVYFFIERNHSPFDDPSFIPLLDETRRTLSLYGEDDEIKLYEEFAHSCNSRNPKNAIHALESLKELVRRKIRKELNLTC